MMKVGEIRYDERTSMYCLRVPQMVLVMSLIASFLLLSAPADAAMHKARPVNGDTAHVSSSTGSADARVSPYTIANRKHAQESRVAHSSAAGLSVQRQHKLADHDQPH